MSNHHHTIQLDGRSLTIEQVIEIAYKFTPVTLGEEALDRVRTCREYVDQSVESGQIVYGVTTGFGINANRFVRKKADMIALQHNLIISHACGTGEPLSIPIVRAMMAIRINTQLAGHSGVREETVLLLTDMLNKGVHPVVPEQGSVGASGDLCPLSHIAAGMIGCGDVFVQKSKADKPVRIKAAKALKSNGLIPCKLSYKEGLALINGTTLMAALGVIAIRKSEKLMRWSIRSGSLAFEALCARKAAFDNRLHEARRHRHQIKIAKSFRKQMKDSTFFGLAGFEVLKRLPGWNEKLTQTFEKDPYQAVQDWRKSYKDKENVPEYLSWGTIAAFATKKLVPQDAYSVRCSPQVFGASMQAIKHVRSIIESELNAAVDNPLIFGTEEGADFLSGGNFHGQPLAIALDYLKIAVAEMGNLLERQINKLLDPATNDALPAFLALNPGLYSGLMIPQYTAASIVSENKVLAHPASVDSIPTSANQEDHVSMGPIAGRHCLMIVENVRRILAIHLLTSAQALDIRRQQIARFDDTLQPSPKTMEVLTKVREKVPFADKDRFAHDDIDSVLELI